MINCSYDVVKFILLNVSFNGTSLNTGVITFLKTNDAQPCKYNKNTVNSVLIDCVINKLDFVDFSDFISNNTARTHTNDQQYFPPYFFVIRHNIFVFERRRQNEIIMMMVVVVVVVVVVMMMVVVGEGFCCLYMITKTR